MFQSERSDGRAEPVRDGPSSGIRIGRTGFPSGAAALHRRRQDRGAEADRAGADDDDRAVRVAPILVGRATVGELAESAALVHAIRLVTGRAECRAERHATKASTSLRLAIAAI